MQQMLLPVEISHQLYSLLAPHYQEFRKEENECKQVYVYALPSALFFLRIVLCILI